MQCVMPCLTSGGVKKVKGTTAVSCHFKILGIKAMRQWADITLFYVYWLFLFCNVILSILLKLDLTQTVYLHSYNKVSVNIFVYVSPEQFNWNVPFSPRVWVFPRIYYSEWLEPSLFSFQNREKLLTETLLYSSLSPLFMQWNEEFAFWCPPLRHISVCFIWRVKSHSEEGRLRSSPDCGIHLTICKKFVCWHMKSDGWYQYTK